MDDGTLIVQGIVIDGFADGDSVITAERSVDSIQTKVGADGEMSVAHSTDKSGRISVVLMQTSESNKALYALLAAQEVGAALPLAVMFKDTGGGDVFTGTNGVLLRPANATRGVNVNTQEWTMVFETLDLIYTGTPSA